MPRYSIVLDRAAKLGLTRREQEVLVLLAEGLSTREVAQELGVGNGTIRDHIASVARKLAATGRIQLILQALEEGVLVHEPEPP